MSVHLPLKQMDRPHRYVMVAVVAVVAVAAAAASSNSCSVGAALVSATEAFEELLNDVIRAIVGQEILRDQASLASHIAMQTRPTLTSVPPCPLPHACVQIFLPICPLWSCRNDRASLLKLCSASIPPIATLNVLCDIRLHQLCFCPMFCRGTFKFFR